MRALVAHGTTSTTHASKVDPHSSETCAKIGFQLGRGRLELGKGRSEYTPYAKWIRFGPLMRSKYIPSISVLTPIQLIIYVKLVACVEYTIGYVG